MHPTGPSESGIDQQVLAQILEKSGMPNSGNFTDGTQYPLTGEVGQETQADDRGSNKTRSRKISIRSGNHVVESGDGLADLRANATGKEIAERLEFAEQKSWPILQDTVSLWQQRGNYVGFLHDPKAGLLSRTMLAE